MTQQVQQLPQLTEEQRKQLEEKLKSMSPEELREFQKQQCIFCQIIAGKVPSKKIYEDEHCLAVLDINPATKGHLLLLPKEHYTIMPQVPAQELAELFVISRSLSQVLLKGLKVSGTNVFIANGLAAGQRAQHFVIHLIPRKEGDGILELDEKLIAQEMQQKIKIAVESKLNELLGVKKEIVQVEEKKEEKEEKREENGEGKEEKGEEVEENEAGEEERKEDGEEKEEPVQSEDKEDVSLDDIADLFK